MIVFLDTKDLISLLQRHKPCDPATFRDALNEGHNKLCLSVTAVKELAAPLVLRGSKTSVMPLLLELERLPVVYLKDGRVTPEEISEAVEAFRTGREYRRIEPFATRLDHAIDEKVLTRLFIRYSLPEVVYDLWQTAPEGFRKRPDHEAKLREALTGDRTALSLPPVEEQFRSTFRRHVGLYQIPAQGVDLDSLADWVYADPNRCPGTRLEFEVFQQLRGNQGDAAGASDFGDFVHVGALPYFDLMTLDRRMTGYLRQATRKWNPSPFAKVVPSVAELLSRL